MTRQLGLSLASMGVTTSGAPALFSSATMVVNPEGPSPVVCPPQ
jgi:hypothetical protein